MPAPITIEVSRFPKKGDAALSQLSRVGRLPKDS
jgi:hypothetical protein